MVSSAAAKAKSWKCDSRILMMTAMAILLGLGVFGFDFSIQWMQVVLAFAVGLACQYFWLRRFNIATHSLLSAGVTCFGIALLLRSNHLWVHPVAAFLAITSKFLIRAKGKHLFNPTALGVALAVLFFPNTWLSPGQWGTALSTAVWIVAFGTIITSTVRRLDISWFFLFFYLGAVFLRNTYLGYEIEIFFHSASSGSLLLFAFFMISDPKTSPDHVFGKALQALIVAVAAFIVHFYYFRQNGFVFALVGSSFLVPLINRLFPAEHFDWRKNDDAFGRVNSAFASQ